MKVKYLVLIALAIIFTGACMSKNIAGIILDITAKK